MEFDHQLIHRYKTLCYRRNQYEKTQSSVIKYYPDKECLARRFTRLAEVYIIELESYIPNEIIDEYTYSETFRQVLSLCSDTFRPDQFDSVFHGGLFHWLDQDFMDWLLSHQNELKRPLTWKQICQLQCNWNMWLEDMTIREVWELNN